MLCRKLVACPTAAPHRLIHDAAACQVWDTRNMRAPVTMFSHDTGGGVWRVKWYERTCCASHMAQSLPGDSII